MIRLRSFEKGDLFELHELDRVCFPPGVSYSVAELRYYLVSPRCSCWVAEEIPEENAEDRGWKLAGFIVIERLHRAGGLNGHIVTIDVRPQARRLGLGKLLMRTAEERMKREGANRLILEVAVNNGAAKAFYRCMGFSRTARIPEYYPGKLDADVMEKAI